MVCHAAVPLGTPIALTFSVCRIANLKIQLAKLDSEAWPGVLDSERDRLILINEKEELLKEMRFISPRKWTQGEVEQLEMARKRLEKDLQAARDTQSKALTERWGSAGACGDGDLLSVLVCALAPSLGKRRSGGGSSNLGPLGATPETLRRAHPFPKQHIWGRDSPSSYRRTLHRESLSQKAAHTQVFKNYLFGEFPLWRG